MSIKTVRLFLSVGLLSLITICQSKGAPLPYGFTPHPVVSAKSVYPEFKQSAFPKPLKRDPSVNLYVTSDKELKIHSAKKILEALGFKVSSVRGIKTKSGVAEQPVGRENGFLGAKNRIASLENTVGDELASQSLNMIVSIENFVQELPAETCVDMAAIVIKDTQGQVYDYLSSGVLAPIEAYREASRHKTQDPTGFSKTVGEVLKEQSPSIDSSNWHPLFTDPSQSRESIILAPFTH